MLPNILLLLTLVINCVVAIDGVQKDALFKVPLEVREKNRPKRLVDDVNDPDMLKLKTLQDKFFNIVGNSSLGKEFKSFNQLLHLVDSEAGIELGRLILSGVMIGFGKENSNELLTEFLDDFQYRVSPEFADAILDYKDFLKTVDLKLIPMTIETLFRKDELGNSLASIPLGQLVDLIQPEASKYGIDIRNLINGIIGKGDSSFPDLVNKIVKNFNASSLINTVTQSATNVLEEPPSKNEISPDSMRPKKNPTLMIFKPMIAKLLKENQIDLEVDAVIQVLTPFFDSSADMIQGLFPSLQNSGKDFDFSKMLPLLGLFASQMGQQNKNSKDQAPNVIAEALSLLGGAGNSKNNNFQAIMQMAMQFMNAGKKPNGDRKHKATKISDSESTSFENPEKIQKMGFDPTMLLQMASSLSGDPALGDGLNILSGLAQQFSGEDSDVGAKKLIELASNLIGGISNKKKKNKKIEPKTDKIVEAKTRKIKTLIDVLEPMLRKLQSDEKSHLKLKDAITLSKSIISNKFGDIEQLKEQLLPLLKTYNSDLEDNFDTIISLFSRSHAEWGAFMKMVSNPVTRQTLIENAVQPATEIVSLLASTSFQNKQNAFLRQQFNQAFASFGLKSVTLNNFPERLNPVASMMSKGWDLPVNLAALLGPSRNSLKEFWNWYSESMKTMRSLPREELEEIVAESLEDDLAAPLVAVWSLSERSKSYSKCLPRAVCDLVHDAAPEDTLKLLVTRLASIFYGGLRGNNEDNFLLSIQVARAAVFEGNCQEYFPIQCSTSKEPRKLEVEADQDKHEEL